MTKCKKSPSGYHQCDCPVGEPAVICQYCGEVMSTWQELAKRSKEGTCK